MQHKTQINTKYKTHTKSQTSLAAQDTEAALNTSSPYNNPTSQDHSLRANGTNSLQPLFFLACFIIMPTLSLDLLKSHSFSI